MSCLYFRQMRKTITWCLKFDRFGTTVTSAQFVRQFNKSGSKPEVPVR